MHRVQSMFPAFCGMYNCSSQTRCWAFPAMQSWVVQLRQVAWLRACRLKGESSEPAKLNCPKGQTYLQKLAPRKKVSTRKAAAKYATSSHAVRRGWSQMAKASYDQKNRIIKAIAIHLLRSQRGHLKRAMPSRWPNSRGSMKGHERQKILPNTS